MLDEVRSTADLFRVVDYLYWLERGTSTPPSLSLYPLQFKSSPEQAFANVESRDPKFAAKTKQLDQGLVEMTFTRRWGKRTFRSRALILLGNGGGTVVSPDRQQVPLLGLLNRSEPDASMIPLNSRDMLGVVQKVKVVFGDNEPEIYRLTARKPGTQTIQAFNNVSVGQCREYVERGYWLDRLRVRVRGDNATLIDFGIARTGAVEFSLGKFEALAQEILGPIIKVGGSKVDFYSKRGLEPTSEMQTMRPLTVRHAMPQNLTSALASKLLAQIEKFPRLSFAVVHSGNPMLLVHIMDDRDGSTYDIAAAEDRLYIIPVFVVSSSALIRARELIYQTFQEGEVEDYYEQTPEPTLGTVVTSAG